MSSIRVLAVLALILSAPALAAPLLPAASACGSQAQVAPELRVKNTAHWTTASEENNFGYDVYRGDSEKGPFVKLTKTPILGNGTTPETHNYAYADDSIDPCKDYWYYVESIATDGSREKFTPEFHVPAKRQASVPNRP